MKKQGEDQPTLTKEEIDLAIAQAKMLQTKNYWQITIRISTGESRHKKSAKKKARFVRKRHQRRCSK